MRRIVVIVGILVGACSTPAIPGDPSDLAVMAIDLASASVDSDRPFGCEKDTDCKGDRICVGRECVEPGAPVADLLATVDHSIPDLVAGGDQERMDPPDLLVADLLPLPDFNPHCPGLGEHPRDDWCIPPWQTMYPNDPCGGECCAGLVGHIVNFGGGKFDWYCCVQTTHNGLPTWYCGTNKSGTYCVDDRQCASRVCRQNGGCL